MGIISVYKHVGETPYDLIKNLKKEDKYKNVKMSYAGRLDPMAHGIMVILTDKDCLRQELYNNLDKIYFFRLLIGLETDTNDILGIIKNNSKKIEISEDGIINEIYNLKGEMDQTYPLFSSKRYNGKPLWYYGKNNLENKIKEYPSHLIKVKDVKVIGDEEVSKLELLELVNRNIYKLDKNKDFRQTIILKKWKEINNINYKVFNIEVEVSSGTYIRGLSKYLGEKIGLPTVCIEIYRKNILI